MKYTKKHIEAIENRLCEYIASIEMGENLIEKCKICDTTNNNCHLCLFSTCFNTTTITGLEIARYKKIYNRIRIVEVITKRYKELTELALKNWENSKG